MMQSITSKKHYFKGDWLWYLALIMIAMVPLFGFLETCTIRMWDEARNAINAYEMYKNGFSIVTTYNGEPDMWNTKPPLLIWIIVSFMHLFGPTELAIRLPSAIAAFITTILVFRLVRKSTESPAAGLIAAIVLVSSFGFIEFHAARSGDYDSMLTLFVTASAISFYNHIQLGSGKHLLYGFLFITLAVLTKGIAGLLITPALLAYFIYKKAVLKTLKNKYFYLGFLLFLIFAVGYYLIRNSISPGYLDAIFKNELGGRYLEVNEGHRGSFFYYYNAIVNSHFGFWAPLMAGGWLISLYNKNNRIKDAGVFCSFMILGYFLVISLGKSKLGQYDLPLYPYLAVFTSVFILIIANLIRDHIQVKDVLTKNLLPLIFVFLICIQPYRDIIGITFKPIESTNDRNTYEIAYYLRNAIRKKNNLDGFKIMNNDCRYDKEFYMMLLCDKGQHVSYISQKDITSGMNIILDSKADSMFIHKTFNFSLIEEKGTLKVYNIQNKKADNIALN